MAEMDFPVSPVVGQKYTNSIGVVYEWNGVAWVVGFYDSSTQTFNTLGDLLDQIRTLLQDTDVSSGEYRYSTDSIVMNLNQGMMEMYRIRPDLFLENDYNIQVFNVAEPNAVIVIEPQYVPALVYYAVGLTQARDDEQTQDQRATGFLKVFQSAIVGGGLIA